MLASRELPHSGTSGTRRIGQPAHALGRSEVARMPVPGRVEPLSFAVVVSAVDPALWFELALELDHPSALQELLDNKCGTLQILERARLGEVRDRA